MGLDHLAVVVLEQVRARAVQHAGRPAESAAACSPVDAATRRLDPDHAHLRLVEERMEQADRIGAAADAGDQRVGQAPSLAVICARTSLPITHWKSRTMAG